MRRLISLGYKCEVAFQLRMHSGNNQSQFFDWLMIPLAGSVIQILKRDFDVFAPEHLVIRTNKVGERRVHDQAVSLSLPHAFPMAGRNVADGFMATYPVFMSKMRFLAQRFRDTVAGGPVTLVRRNITPEQAVQLEAAFFDRFPGADARFLYIQGEGPVFATDHGHSRVVREWGSHGDARAWAKMLGEEGLIGQPYRLSIGEITGFRPNYDFGGTSYNLTELRHALSFNPDNPHLHHEAALAARRDGELEAAQTHIDAAAAAAPGDILIQCDKLLIDRRNGKLNSEALLDGLIALNGNGGNSELARHIVLELFRQGRPIDALAFFGQYFKDNPFDGVLMTVKAEALIAAGRINEAEMALGLALGLVPDQAPAWRLRAEIFRRKGDAAAAVAADAEAARLERGAEEATEADLAGTAAAA